LKYIFFISLRLKNFFVYLITVYTNIRIWVKKVLIQFTQCNFVDFFSAVREQQKVVLGFFMFFGSVYNFTLPVLLKGKDLSNIN